jgi:Reverse transcriptase (RNA-dependent DNA polymerase)
MLCIPKKNSTLHTVFNLREQNENTVKDITPFPNQDIIRNDIARTAYRMKLDMSEAYEQICMDPAHVSKTAFATILGTFRSQVMQMGDCNAPSTFQCLMTAIFHDCIGCFVHIFIFSCSIEEHEKHLGIVFNRLHKNHLFLCKKKVDLYSERMECLSHIIDDRGIHADADKMQRVREWRMPRMYNDVQRFLGLVQYLAHYMPDVSAYTTPLAGCIRNNRPFEWTPLLDKCLQSIKALACCYISFLYGGAEIRKGHLLQLMGCAPDILLVLSICGSRKIGVMSEGLGRKIRVEVRDAEVGGRRTQGWRFRMSDGWRRLRQEEN